MAFEFEYNGEVQQFDGCADALEAMGQANKVFDLPEGIWMEAGLGKFRWVEGNFFD
jgi:hypothetical protein